MKIIFESDTEEDFIEVQLTEREIKSLLTYHAVEASKDFKDQQKKPINIFIRRGPNAIS